MQATARRPDDFGHALFNRHMDVFVLHAEDELACFDFSLDLLEPAADRFGVFFRDDALAREHRCVRDRVGDVKRTDALLERDRCVEAFNEFVGRKIEAAASALGILVFLFKNE